MTAKVGDQLPALDVPLTRTFIVSAALATRDYQDVHHDPDRARERGAPDIFMNIMTTNGLIGRFVTDWAGPRASMQRVKIRLGVPNYPGDTMTLTGSVTAVDGDNVTVDVRGANSLGDHVTGTVEVVVPS